jgi:DNA-binding NtrC family response regulator
MSQSQPQTANATHSILVVDDHPPMRESLALLLEDAGFYALEASGGRDALRHLEESPVHAALVDLKMEDMSGLDLLREIRRRDQALPVILITAYGTIESAVEAMQIGAVDYLTKPYDQESLLSKLRSSIASTEDLLVQLDGESGVAPESGFLFRSRVMQKVWARMKQAAGTHLSVLITGETGTGKNFLARELHDHSPRADGPFVNINCASLPESLLESELFGHVRGSFTGAANDKEGLFEAAHTGTLFLDEVGAMSEALQAKLLGVLQDSAIRRVGANRVRQVDIRVIAATGESEVRNDGCPMSLREDLFYRLNGVRFHLPPMRERPEDVGALAEAFLQKFAAKYEKPLQGFQREAMALIQRFQFPGNVRQLQTVMEQVVAFADPGVTRVTVADLPPEIQGEAPIPPDNRADPERDEDTTEAVQTLEEQEIATIKHGLECNGHNLTQTARTLGIGRTTLWRKMKRYGLG